MNSHTERDRNQIFIEVPSIPFYPCPERIPSPSDPIESIYFNALILRTLASGNVRWWVLIFGWLYYDTIFIAYTSFLLLSLDSLLLPAPIITVVPLFPLTRGTANKLSQRHRV
jgi:hypothetical protein